MSSVYSKALNHKLVSSDDLLARRKNRDYGFIMDDIIEVLEKSKNLIAADLQQRSPKELSEILELLELGTPLALEILTKVTDVISTKVSISEPEEIIDGDEQASEPKAVTKSDTELSDEVSTAVGEIISENSASVESLIALSEKFKRNFTVSNPITKDISSNEKKSKIRRPGQNKAH